MSGIHPSALSARSRLCRALLPLAISCALAGNVFSQITNKFTDGEGSATPDQYPGSVGEGWLEPWTTVFGTTGTPAAVGFYGVEPHVINSAPMNGGGNYLNVGIANSESTIRRRYTSKDDLDVREPHIIEFDIRLDNWLPAQSSFSSSSDLVTISTRPNTGSGSSDNNSTFWIKVQGAAGTGPTVAAKQWSFYNGGISSSSESGGTFVSTASPAFAFGVVYHFKIETDPVNKLYKATVSDGTNSFTTDFLRWRQFSSTSESNRTNATYLTFASRTSTRTVQPAATETNILSIDNITINHAPFDGIPPKLSGFIRRMDRFTRRPRATSFLTPLRSG